MSPPKKGVWSRSWAGKEREKTGQMLRRRAKSGLSSLGERKKNAHLPTRVYNDHGCDYVQLRATAFAEIDEHHVWRKDEGVSAEACAEREGDSNRHQKVDGICATRSGHVVKTMTVETF